ncbi:PAS domain-containing protein [bacterium]|nr:PAS domain-containing protein [bacterium]
MTRVVDPTDLAARYLRAATETAVSLTATDDPASALQSITDALVSELDGALARVWLYERETDTLVLRASSGLSRATTGSSRARISVATYPYKVGVVARTRKPFVQNGLDGDPHFEAGWVARERIASVAVFPLIAGSELLGVLVHFSRSHLPDLVVEVLRTFVAMLTIHLHERRLEKALEDTKHWSARMIEATEERLRSVIAHAPIIVFALDERGVITLSEGGRTLEALGWKPGELVGRSVFELYANEPGVLANTRRALAGEAFTATDVLSGGTAFETHYSPIKDSEGRLRGTIGIATDVTERHRVEEALKLQQRDHQIIFDAVPAMIWYKDDKNRILRCNEAAARAAGKTVREMEGRKTEDFYPDEAARYLADDLEVIRSGKPKLGIVEPHQIASGQKIWVQTDKIPYRDERENIVGVIVFARDITDLKRMEQELLKAAKLETIGLLAAGIAHDFNNILTIITANVSLAKHAASSPPSSETPDLPSLLGEIEAASGHAKDLTQQLLVFSKGGAPARETTSIGDLVRESAGFALHGSNVRCELSLPPDLWPVDVDRVQIDQVVHNLVLNAQQAMPKGGVLRVSAENVNIGSQPGLAPLPPGRYVRLSFEDQGVGIERENLPKIFDPFFTTKSTGTGLGLTPTYSIIKRHEGHISCESEMGVGTTFRILLPASDQRVLALQEGASPPVVGRGRILVMDDQDQIRAAMAHILRHLGYDASFARHGLEAIELYSAAMGSPRPFDAVIMDLTVPGGMGGRDALERLLAIDPDVRAIVSSGYSNDPVMANYKGYGFRGLIAKPFDLEGLSAVLHDVLG